MRLNTKTDYCVRILIFLQKNSTKVRIKDIAESYNISKNHLSVAANKLVELGYVISTQGPSGGIQFNPEFRNKTLGDLIFQIEQFEIVECFDPENSACSLDPSCKLKGMLNKATFAFLNELKKYKIKDLI